MSKITFKPLPLIHQRGAENEEEKYCMFLRLFHIVLMEEIKQNFSYRAAVQICLLVLWSFK